MNKEIKKVAAIKFAHANVCEAQS